MDKKYKVLIMRCDEYDPLKISNIIQKGMKELNVVPKGRILLKPNTVIAHPKLFPNAFTRKEFLDGLILATKALAENTKELSIGERSGITVPTRAMFKMAGYLELIKKHKIKVHYFDEVRQVPFALKKKEALRKNIFIPEPIAKTDYLINVPKFKAHPWCRLTLSLKNFIGIQDDRHRLVDHNLFLEQKIADLQEVIQPKFIAIDAITAGQKMMLTPIPFHMGAIVMGTNSCAVDAVGCHMVNINPVDVSHLCHTAKRGFGPIDINEIDVKGDFPLKEVQERTKDFKFCMEHIDSYFGKNANIDCTIGNFPEKHSSDYCWGGCPGAIQEAVHIYKTIEPEVLKKMKKIHYVVGNVKKDLKLKKGEKVLFAGKCTNWEGKINGEDVKIKSSYKTNKDVDEKKTKSNDMLLRTFKTLWNCFKNRKKAYIHAKACPVSVGDHVHYLSVLGKIKNINFDSRIVFHVNIGYLQMRFFRFINHLKF